jgi:hypothetical protein
MPYARGAVVLWRVHGVVPGIRGSVGGEAPPQPRDGAGQAAHLQHPAGLVVLLDRTRALSYTSPISPCFA